MFRRFFHTSILQGRVSILSGVFCYLPMAQIKPKFIEMKKYLFSILFSIAFIAVSAQEEFSYFNKLYLSDTTSLFTMPIVATEDGYFVAGLFGGFSDKGIFVQKLDLEGEVVWAKQMDQTNEDYKVEGLQSGGKFILNSDGNLILLYSVRNYDINNSLDQILIEFDNSGEIISKIKYENSLDFSEFINDIKQVKYGEYIGVGFKGIYSSQWTGIYIMKLAEDFDIEWEREYTIDGEAVAWNVLELPDGDFLVGAYARVDGDNYDSWLLKLDKNDGDIVWDETLGGGGG